jgi:MFS family permease
MDMDNITIYRKHQGLRVFLWVWFGQFVSVVGSGMTRFVLMIWAYQQTASATTLALLGTANFIPYLIFSPLAGVVVDRWDRRKVLLLADAAGGLVTGGLLILYLGGWMQIWHLYVAEAVIGTVESFQIPAYFAAVTTLVPRDQLVRTNGLRALARNGSAVIAPLLAGVLLAWLGIRAVLVIDLITFLFSIVVLGLVFIPMPPQSNDGRASQGSILQEMRVGFGYILKRPGCAGCC